MIELGKIANVIMGISPKGNTYNNHGDGLPLLNGPTEFGDSFPSCTLFTTTSVRESEPGDLIFCVRGSTGRMNWADQKYSLGRGVCAIRGQSISETKFIRYALENRLSALLQMAGGTTFPNLPRDIITTFNIPYPQNRERTVDILSTYDSLIENNRRRIQILEQSAKLLYKEWFVHFRFPGHEHVKIVNGVPKGWTRTTLSEVATVIMGQSPPSEFYNDSGEGLPFHQGVSTYGERFLRDEVFCTSKGRIGEDGDIICSVRAPVGRLNITRNKVILGRGVASIRSKSGHQSFLFYQLGSIFFKEDLFGSGAIFASIKRPDLEKLSLLLPDQTLLNNFEDQVHHIDSQIDTLDKAINVSQKARDLLLPRLMNGEIEV